MPFHVEIAAGFRHARVFNLEREDLEREVIVPWVDNRPIEMGDREWLPKDSSLTVLDGPRMENADLSFGQGWANAERASTDVTGKLLSGTPVTKPPDAFVIESETPEALAADVVAGHGGRVVAWSEARERIDGRDPRVAAVILVLRQPSRNPD